nr:FKBP-type peptidylprolyl isomerase [uncultured Blautia sp.]
MKDLLKRTTIAALAGVLAAGMFTGCGEKKVDGTKTVATVDGTDVPMGVLSLFAREQQAQTIAMYQQFMGGSASNIWSGVADEDTGETYGESAVKSALKQVELLYVMKEKAADYNVEITEDEQKGIEDAAAAFMKDNDEDTIKELSVTEDQVKTLLELETYQKKMQDPIKKEGNIEVSEDDAQQSAFTYVNISLSGDDLTDDDIAKRKEQAQEILDKVKEDPTADMKEIAKGVDDSYTALNGTFTTKESDDEDFQSTAYPDEVLTALRTLKEGEVYDSLVETDTAAYILRLDSEKDEDATASKVKSVTTTKENKYYSETTEKWLDDAKVTEDEKVLKTLTFSDNHTFTIKATTSDAADEAEVTPTEEAAEETEVTPTEEAAEETEVTPTEEAAEETEVTPTEEAAEETEVTPTEEAADDTEE